MPYTQIHIPDIYVDPSTHCYNHKSKFEPLLPQAFRSLMGQPIRNKNTATETTTLPVFVGERYIDREREHYI